MRLILVGGFLGAGKTTLLACAGRRLAERGKKVGFITNDQAAELVDTVLLKQTGLDVKDVSGACFCCKFDDLIGKSHEFLAHQKPDLLFAEPVGSCTDLSATVIQPIKKFYGDKLRVAPFSVVVDPDRLQEALADTPTVFNKSVLYIYGKQLEEADIIVLNKSDRLTLKQRESLTMALSSKFPQAKIMVISARNGDGIDAWLDEIQKDLPAGKHIAEVDYDTYAEGEAVLGWLNASIELEANSPVAWRDFAFDLLRAFKLEFQARNAEVAHVKLFITAQGTGLVANLTSTRGMPFVLVQGTAGAPTAQALMILNARVHISPHDLKTAVEKVLGVVKARPIAASVKSLECFSPGRPKPTHRFAEVV